MQHELEIALEAAREAAAAVRAIWHEPDAWLLDKEGGRGPLTRADLAADEILARHLRARFPDDGWLSEETSDDRSRLDKSRVWIVDPLDGTQEFVDRVEEFVVSVALVVDGSPALGVLVHPTVGTELTAIVGVGAWKDGNPVRVTARGSLDGARVLVSRTEMKKGWFRSIEGRARLEPVGSVAWKLGLVGAGLADATFTPRPRNTWDLAAGAAIVEAAGGRCSDNDGRRYRMNEASPLLDGVVISNGLLHDDLLALATTLRAP